MLTSNQLKTNYRVVRAFVSAQLACLHEPLAADRAQEALLSVVGADVGLQQRRLRCPVLAALERAFMHIP